MTAPAGYVTGVHRTLSHTRRRARRWNHNDVIILTLVSALAILFMVPIYVIVANALKRPADALASNMWRLPLSISLKDLVGAFQALSSSLGNSILLTVVATAASCIIGAVNGYILQKLKFRGADLFLVILMFGMFIPYQVILVPLVATLHAIGLYGSIWGLILTHTVYGIPITTLIFRNFYTSIPNAILEAAAIDGAGFFRTFYSIILRLSVPGFVVAGIFQFTGIWNDFLFGLTVVPNPSAQPVTVALNNLAGSTSVNWGIVIAGAFLAALPTALVYLLLGKYFVSGLMAGSVK